MEKRQILRELLTKGIQPTPGELEKIRKGETGLPEARDEGRGSSGFSVTISETKGKKLSAKEFIKIYNKKFEILSGIILKKVRATSISNARKIFSKNTVVGRVQDMTPEGFLLEDVTGETEVMADEDSIRIGDVIGVTGHFREGKFFSEDITYPDVPLTREDRRPKEMEIAFTTKVPESMGKNGVVLCPGDCPGGDKVVTNIPDPGRVKIKKGERVARILVMKSKNKTDESDAFSFIRRRTLPESGTMDFNNVIWEVPDMFWIFENDKNWTKNYKGIVIISTDPQSYVKYDVSKNDIRFEKI